MTTVKSSTSNSSHKKPVKSSTSAAAVAAKTTARIKKPVAKVAAPKRIAQHPRAREITGITPEQRLRDIAVAAYYIAERRGFAPGDPLEDWVQGEAEIDCLLAAKHMGQMNS